MMKSTENTRRPRNQSKINTTRKSQRSIRNAKKIDNSTVNVI